MGTSTLLSPEENKVKIQGRSFISLVNELKITGKQFHMKLRLNCDRSRLPSVEAKDRLCLAAHNYTDISIVTINIIIIIIIIIVIVVVIIFHNFTF